MTVRLLDKDSQSQFIRLTGNRTVLMVKSADGTKDKSVVIIDQGTE